MILAAGRGRRLIPHTNHRPKPLLLASDRPMLAYTLDALEVAGVKDVCLVVGYLGEQIEQYLTGNNQWPLKFTFRTQSQQLGTAHALSAAADFLTAPSFILAADYILPRAHLSQLKLAYCRSSAPLAVSLKRLEAHRLAQSSSVALAADGSIMRIEEKPEPGTAPSNLAASLIYIVPGAITGYLQKLPLSSRGEYEIVAVINRMIADGMPITGVEQSAPPEWRPQS